jgi:hypothetical protein
MIRIQDIGGIFSKAKSKGQPNTFGFLWKQLAGKLRLQLQALAGEYQNFQNTISDSNDVIKAKGNLTDLLDELINQVVRALDAEHVCLSLLEGQPQVFWVVAYKGDCHLHETPLNKKFMAESFSRADGLCD